MFHRVIIGALHKNVNVNLPLKADRRYFLSLFVDTVAYRVARARGFARRSTPVPTR